jgi:hypothetical protein
MGALRMGNRLDCTPGIAWLCCDALGNNHCSQSLSGSSQIARLVFVTADHIVLAAASAEGLATDNPDNY